MPIAARRCPSPLRLSEISASSGSELRLGPEPTHSVLRLFSLTGRHTLLREGDAVQVFHPELTAFQRQVLTLEGVPQGSFRSSA